jgi:hypothetical protein
MNHYTVKRLALVLAVQAEIDAMKIEIAVQHMEGHKTTEGGFFVDKADELRNLAHAHDEQL